MEKANAESQKGAAVEQAGNGRSFGPTASLSRRSQPLLGSFAVGPRSLLTRWGFPSPPQVTFPTRDERFAFCGAVGPNLGRAICAHS